MKNIYGYNSMIPLVSSISSSSPILDSSDSCDKKSTDPCSSPNNKELCNHNICYDGLEECQEANLHSPSSQPFTITPDTSWNSDSIAYIMSKIPNDMDDTISKDKIPVLFQCMIQKAQSKNISPFDFLNTTGAFTPSLRKNITTDCLKNFIGGQPPPPGPSGFLKTTTGKIIFIIITILVLLMLIILTYFITKNK
jgi:hypothetical protein